MCNYIVSIVAIVHNIVTISETMIVKWPITQRWQTHSPDTNAYLCIICTSDWIRLFWGTFTARTFIITYLNTYVHCTYIHRFWKSCIIFQWIILYPSQRGRIKFVRRKTIYLLYTYQKGSLGVTKTWFWVFFYFFKDVHQVGCTWV